jgi:hypothetical protein
MPLSQGAIRICKCKFISFPASNAQKKRRIKRKLKWSELEEGGDVKVRPNYKMAESESIKLNFYNPQRCNIFFIKFNVRMRDERR